MAKYKIYHILLASSALSCATFGLTTPGHAGPEDGTITAGAATITQTGPQTSIYQSSERAIIDWRSFDVGAHESVRFYQPGSSSITLNRINDSKASIIDGHIEANGKILLLNQNGVVFGSGSRVDVAGLVASTGNIDDGAFMSGSVTLQISAGNNSHAKIINRGTITAHDAGLVGLVAPNVENDGVITAYLGKVTLAGAERVTLDLAGDTLISIDVSDMISGAVKNSGAITADGGTITLTAARARQAVESSIINTGSLQANNVGIRNGRIILSAGGNHAGDTGRGQSAQAAIVHAGTIKARSGQVELLGDSVHVQSGSVIDVSGSTGGNVNIGGSYQGASDRVTATWVEVDRGSTIQSNGDIDGDGGRIILWADRLMAYYGRIEAEGGDESGDGGFVEISGKNRLIYDGTVSTLAAHGKTGMLLLDPTNIEITNTADQNVTGTTPFEPNADDVVSVLDAATLLAALGSSSVTVQTRATGSQAGDITVNAALNWVSGNTLTLDAHHDIIINQAITGANLMLTAGNDVSINAALTGSGLLHILPKSAGGTMGIGTGATGTLQLSSTDLANITDGWSTIQLGRTDGSGAITLAAHTWTDNLEIDSGNGAITVNGAQTMGANNLTIRTDADLVLNAALTGTGALNIIQSSAATTMGLGTGQAGTLNLTTAEIGSITNGWTSMTFGRTDGSGAINIGALTWNDILTVQSGAGAININGAQTMGANNLTFITDANPAIGAALTGTGTLTVRAASAGTGIGLGTGQAGAIGFTNAELSNITDGWTSLIFGRTDGTGAINVGARTWTDALTLQTGNAVISINGAQTMGANALTITSDGNPVIGAALTGTGTLTFQTTSPGTSIGLAGSAGTFELSEAELLNITDGWANIIIGRTDGSGAVALGTHTWTDALTLQSGSGVVTVSGAQTMGANALTITADADLVLNAALTGSGILTLQSSTAGTTTGVAGGAGTFELSSADLANLTDGWSSIIIGRTDQSGSITVGAATWADRLTLRSGSGTLTISGTQTMGANNLTLSTDSDIILTGNLTGAGTLTVQGTAIGTSIGLAGQAGTVNLDTTEIGRITDGWTELIFGRSDTTGAINIGADTWTDNLTVQSNTGVITFAGAQTMGANNLTIRTDADLVVNATLGGTGNLTVSGNALSTTMGIGTGQAGTLALTNAEVAFLTNTWTNIFMGRSDGTGAITVGALTWNDPLTFQSGTGVITIAGIQTMAANALTFTTDGDVALNAGLSGSTTLTIQQASVGTTMGFGNAAAGTVNLTATEVANITNGWTNLNLGRTDATGQMTLTANTWNDTLNLRSGVATINITGTQTLTANNMNITTDGDINLTGALTSSGTLTVSAVTAATTIGLGNAAAGTINLTATEISRITNGWGSLVFGSTTGTGAITMTANTWNDNLTLRSLTGVITISGAQTMGANNLTLQSDGDLSVTAGLTSTGTLTISGQTASTTMGIGTGQVGTIQISDAEAANLDNTWGSIVFGRTDGTGDINIGALTWVDPVTYRSLTGAINITGTQTMTTNGLTITTDGNLNVGGTLSSTGTGTLTITGQSATTSIGLGTGQVGTLQLSDAEVTNLTNGWASVVIGLTTSTGAINVGTATWLDPLTLRTAAGIITFNGNQTMGANNLTITTNGDIGVDSLLTGTGTLTITQQTAATTMGIGTGAAGTIGFTDAEVANMTGTWASVVLGLATATGAMNVNALTWVDPLTLRTGTGVMTIAGTQTMGANNLTLSTDSNLALSGGANLTGTGNLTITSSAVATGISLGTGQTGTLNLNDTEITQISDGWTNVIIGNAAGTGAMNVGTSSWNDTLTLRTLGGVIGINGTVTMNAANNLTVTTDGNMNIGASGALTGTGNLIIQTNAVATTIGLGNGATGTLNLTDVELGRITDGWANLTFGQAGGTGIVTVGANTFNDNVTIQTSTGAMNLSGATTYNGNVTLMTTTGVITVSGAMNVQNNNLTITTNGNPVFSAAVQGSGILTIQGQAVATVMTIAGASTGLALENTDLANILNGWSSIVFGRNDATGTMNIGAYTWQYDTTFKTGSGVMTISGAQTSTGNAMTYETDGNLSIAANLSGTGTLTIRGSAAGTTMGLAGGGGTLALTAAELNFIQDGWNQLVFGRTNATGAFAANARTWADNVQFISGTGTMTVAAQTMGANNLTLTTDSNLAISANQVSTGGRLIIETATPGVGIGVGTGQTGTLVIDNTEIGRFATTGWSSVQIGNASSTAAINLGTYNWATMPMTFITNGNIVLNGVQTSTRTSGNSLVFASLAGNFVNNTGSATPINPGTGTARYLIYSTSAATDTYGTFVPPGSTGMQTYFSYGPSAVVEAGNRIIYSQGAPKIIFVQIDNKTKVYGDTVPTLTWTYLGGLQGGDTLAAAIASSSLSATGALVTDNAGSTRTITGSFTPTGLGYTVSFTTGTLTTIKAPVSVQAANASREYGDANPTFTINYTGLRNGETSTVIDTLATAATTAVATSNVNTYAITSSGAIDDNYVFNYTNGTLTITKATLTITAEDKTREYGDANPALTVTYSGFKNSETSAVIDTNPTLATTAIATTGVGTVAITLTGGTDNNYNFTLVNGILTITPATITATADNQTREYGDANPALTVSYSGFKNGETSADLDTLATAVTTATATTGVGNHVITTSGAADTNYVFTYVDGTLSITKAMITATADNQTREYGDANPALTVSYSGFKNGETSAVFTTGATAATTAIATTGVGNVAITVSGATDDNYDFTYVAGTLAITKATLTATANNQTREYGDANPALTVSFTGFKNGETSVVIDNSGTASTSANALSNVGNYAINGSGATDDNYNFSYVAGNLAITQATLTATANNQSREYGDANPALTVSYTGFKNGETSAVIDTAAVAVTGATATSNVGGYAITASGAVDTNYIFTYVDGTLTINKATITVTANDASREYGDANPALGISYSGFKNGETSAVIDTGATAATTAIATTNVGTVAITASGAADTNYDFSYVNGTLTITKAMLTATANDASREYGDANPALGVSYSGFKNGETSAVLDTAATAATTAIATTNAGTVAITASGGVDGNYDFTYVAGTLTITKATLTATADNQSREYGDANPALTISYSGFKNGETSAVIDTAAVGATSATTTSNVGGYAITASGGIDNNYNFSYVGGTLTVTKAILTATANNQTREYGDANPALTISYTGFKNGETAAVIDTSASAVTPATITSNVGNYAITASGASDINYDFTYVAGNLAITRAMLTATAEDKTREYGDANPVLTTAYTGFKNGETSAVIDSLATAVTAAINTSNVGNYAITTSGATDGNYDFTYVAGNLAITKADLTITADNQTREYGDANPALTLSYSGFKNGETSAVIDTGPAIGTTAIATTNVGNVAITLTGGTDNNYNLILQNGTLAITKATLTATADDQTREYGDANPTLTTSYTGFKNGETAAVINIGATAITTATNTSNVGSYVISTSGASDNNYDFVYADGSLSITKAMLTATANNQSREYGDANPALTVAYTGFKNGETAAVIDTAANAVTAATPTSNVGSYAITVSGANDVNYDFTYVNGTLSVGKAIITVTADNQTREYGDANPALTVSYSGFKNGETSAVIDTGATAATTAIATTNVGNVAITASGAMDTNYDFAYVNGTLSITKATLTATADNQSREYGDANPTLTVSYGGFKNGETSAVLDTAVTASTTATPTSNVGSYTITASGGTDNNYNYSYVNGTLSVTQATLTVTANNQTREYGDANPALTVSYSGFKNGETSAVLDTAATANTAATNLSNVGTYAITASGAADTNYAFSYVGGTLTVSKATLTATADNQTREYGDANPALTVSYTGFKNGETSAVIDTAANAATAATNLSNVGNYAITASGAADTNYDFVYTAGTLAITKATVSVTANNASREYGDANPTFTALYSGFKNGETEAVLDTAVSLTTPAGLSSNVGTYAITASGAADINYDFTYTGGTLTITQANLTVTANNASREYGDANPSFSVAYSGFKNGETSSVLDVDATASTAATILSNAGTYAITASGGTDNNYAYVYVSGTLTITKADLTITADNQTREYGDANPALTMSYSGFKNGDAAGVLDTGPTIGTTAIGTTNVGTVAITLTGGTDNNYNYVLQNGTLTITKATLTATADNQTREYGDANPALTATYTGFKNGETAAVIDTGVNVTTGAGLTTNVGSYAITTSGGLDNNYIFAYANSSLTITQAALTVTINNATREYGDSDPSFSASYSGFKNGETASVLDVGPNFSTTATIGSNVGNYTITASGSDNNYALTFVDGNLSVTQAALTVLVDNQTRVVGDPNPPLTYTLSGLRNGDTSAVLSGLSVTTPANGASPAGTYAITASGASATNYSISYSNNVMVVTGAALPPVVDPLPSGTLPMSAGYTLAGPGKDGMGYNTLYNTPSLSYVFLNNIAPAGQETAQGTIRTSDGYIAIFYYRNPFIKYLGDPLVFIDPNLYFSRINLIEDEEDSLALLIH